MKTVSSALRWLLIALRFIIPQVLRVLFIMVKVVLTAAIGFWTWVPTSVNKMVKTWMEQAWSSGIPTEYDTILHWVFTIVAYIMIILGWVGYSYLTIIILLWLL